MILTAQDPDVISKQVTEDELLATVKEWNDGKHAQRISLKAHLKQTFGDRHISDDTLSTVQKTLIAEYFKD